VKTWNGSIENAFDVVIVGSGAIGLTAALAASTAGASVAVFEKAPFLGGTSAISGGMIWIPMNRYMAELGHADSPEAALNYLRAVSDGRTADSILDTLIRRGTEMLEFVERESGLTMSTLEEFPDYHPDWPGSVKGGRSLEPDLFDLHALGPLAESLRPDHRPPFTMREYEDWRIFTRFPWDDLERRRQTGLVARGRALVAPLLKACADRGVTLVTDAPVDRLRAGGGRVTGIDLKGGVAVDASTVILASGGFEWSPEMVANFLPGPVQGSCSPPHNTGDGIRMASKVGAKLGNMREAWWGPMVAIPGDVTDGHQTSTLLRFERTGPGSIIVNRNGERFVNEAHNYNDMTKAFHTFDPRAYGYTNLPAYLIFDQRHLDEYGFLSHRADQPTPEWLTVGDSLVDLAQQLGVDPSNLELTVKQFNADASNGVDPAFHRGESAYDRYWGDQLAPHPALGPVDQCPYYGIEVFSGVIGTKGGITTDGEGRALDPFDDVIPGLFAAGNTTSHPMGPGYPGAGGTLGPGMTMGYAAGCRAATG